MPVEARADTVIRPDVRAGVTGALDEGAADTALAPAALAAASIALVPGLAVVPSDTLTAVKCLLEPGLEAGLAVAASPPAPKGPGTLPRARVRMPGESSRPGVDADATCCSGVPGAIGTGAGELMGMLDA